MKIEILIKEVAQITIKSKPSENEKLPGEIIIKVDNLSPIIVARILNLTKTDVPISALIYSEQGIMDLEIKEVTKTKDGDLVDRLTGELLNK